MLRWRFATAAKALDDAKKNLERKDYKPVSDYNLNSAQAAYELTVNNLQTAQGNYTAVANRAEDDVIRNMAWQPFQCSIGPRSGFMEPELSIRTAEYLGCKTRPLLKCR